MDDDDLLQRVDISFDASSLQNLDFSLQREWIVTNGLGGYASATLCSANTRRYHGLLVAALNPPVGRCVLLSKLEETLILTPTPPSNPPLRYELSTNIYPNATHPNGYRWLTQWHMLPVPSWQWQPAEGVKIQKQVWMPKSYNAVCVAYTLLEAPSQTSVRLELVPLLAWRNYHQEMAASGVSITALWCETNRCLRLRLPAIEGVTQSPIPLVLRLRSRDDQPFPNAAFSSNPCWYYHFLHPREAERGLDFSEDLYSPGSFSISLHPKQTVVVQCGVEPLPDVAPQKTLEEIQQSHIQLIAKAPPNEDPFEAQLLLASNAFLVRPPNGRSTIIAGYPWFTDWGRDTMIALPGLCLVPGHIEMARSILLSFATFVDAGMIPNRFPDTGSQPEYNTVDASLWFVTAAWRTFKAQPDEAFLKQIWPALQNILEGYKKGTRFNIHVDSRDHLLYAGAEGVQLTWMDAKVGDFVVTPRIGKAVEINALWYNALMCMADLAVRLHKTQEALLYTQEARQTMASFQTRFARKDQWGLYDVLDTPPHGTPDPSIRPNQIFAISLPFPVIPPTTPLAKTVLDAVQEKLWTPFGLRTLAPEDPNYHPRYEGNVWQRDTAYHQGTAWPWLLGAFAEAVWRVTGNKKAARKVLEPLATQLDRYGVGTLAEVYDADAPQRPNGCIAQAWSVAETLRVWHELK